MFDWIAKVFGDSFERAPWGWALLGTIIGGYYKLRPTMTKLANTREVNLLNERAEEMDLMRARIAKLEDKAEQKELLHEAERSYDRHRINNLATSLNGFFMLVKNNPQDAVKAAESIEALRKEQQQEENKERLALQDLAAKLKLRPSPDLTAGA